MRGVEESCVKKARNRNDGRKGAGDLAEFEIPCLYHPRGSRGFHIPRSSLLASGHCVPEGGKEGDRRCAVRSLYPRQCSKGGTKMLFNGLSFIERHIQP